jgi:hypothetical protein
MNHPTRPAAWIGKSGWFCDPCHWRREGIADAAAHLRQELTLEPAVRELVADLLEQYLIRSGGADVPDEPDEELARYYPPAILGAAAHRLTK